MTSQVPSSALSEAIRILAGGRSLSRAESRGAFDVLMEGKADPSEVESLLIGLRARGENADEVAGAVDSLRAVMITVDAVQDRLVDTCGTGGGGTPTFNISSAASFVAAGAGVRIAKHGNRSHTTRSGSADLFEALGIDIGLGPEEAKKVLASVGLVFLYAPHYHPAMRHVAPIRKKLGVSTILNLVGPVANPAHVERQAMGVFDSSRGPVVAEALRQLNRKHALVMHARAGMDEISPAGETEVWEVRSDQVTTWMLDPKTLGLECADLTALAGGSPAENAIRTERLLMGDAGDEVGRCAVLLNAAAAIYVSEDGLSLEMAAERARDSLASGAAGRVLLDLRRAAPAGLPG